MVDKSEIEKMPGGMTSEELDAMTTEDEETTDKQDVVADSENTSAQEALDAVEAEKEAAAEPVDSFGDDSPVEKEPDGSETKDEPEKDTEEEPKVDPKDAVIGEFRRKNRETELENARLKGQLEERKSMATEKPTEKVLSPLDKAEAAYVEQYGELPEGGLPMTGNLHREQVAFENKIAAEKTAATQKETAKTTSERAVSVARADTFSEENMGKGLDIDTVVNLGQPYLTSGNALDIEEAGRKDGINAAIALSYKLCKNAVLAQNNADTKLLVNAIKIQMAKKSQAKPKNEKEQLDVDALTTKGEDDSIVKGEAEVIGAQHDSLMSFLEADGFMEG